LTTARIMAIRVLDLVIEKIGAATTWSRCSTHRLSIGGTNEAVAEGLAYWVKRYPRLAWYFQILYQRYGLDASAICGEATTIHKGLDPDPHAEPIRAEVRYVCRNEMVCTLEDLLERRAGFLYWAPEERLERARYGARVIRAELDLTEKEFEYQFALYREHLTRFHSLPGSLP
jgi:glycerol-3-phosphate dehydrogenase